MNIITVHDIINDLARHPDKRYRNRPLSGIDRIIIHHSATEQGDPYSFARYHVHHHDWPGIGYHFVIMKTGHIYQTNKIYTRSYHTSGQNTKSIGICVVGNYDNDDWPPEVDISFKYLYRHLSNIFGRIKIYGHRDFSNKSCPGNMVDIHHLRQNLGL